jgi:hypothetical protein
MHSYCGALSAVQAGEEREAVIVVLVSVARASSYCTYGCHYAPLIC